jgi:hypothetical protein
VIVASLAEDLLPRHIGGRRDDELREQRFDDAREHRGFVGEVAVDRHPLDAELRAEPSHRERVESVAVDDRKRRLGDP